MFPSLRTPLSTVCLTVLVAGLSACGSTERATTPSAAPGTAAAGQSALASSEGSAAGKQAANGKSSSAEVKTIAFLNYTRQAAALRRVESGMGAAAKALGWKFVSCDAQGNPQKVAGCASSFIQRDVDIIASVAIPQALMTTELKEARAKNIPWISSGGQIPDNEDLFAGSFYYPEAKLYGPLHKQFLSAIGDSGEIAALQLTVDSTARARQVQLDSDLKTHPNVKVVDRIEGTPSNPSAATASILATLRRHPSIKGIWSCCDIFNQPIVQAIRQAGLTGDKRPVVVGPFPDESVLEAIRDGDFRTAVELPWEAYGWMAVDEAVQHVVNATALTSHAEPTQYPAPLYAGLLVTKENVQPDKSRLQDPAYDYSAYFTAKWKVQFGA